MRNGGEACTIHPGQRPEDEWERTIDDTWLNRDGVMVARSICFQNSASTSEASRVWRNEQHQTGQVSDNRV